MVGSHNGHGQLKTQNRHRQVAAILAAAGGLYLLSGCGWIFSKHDKPMQVTIELIGSDSLNFDGRSVQSVQVKAYVLSDPGRFGSAAARAFFDPDFNPGFSGAFAKDTLGAASVIVSPGETSKTTISLLHTKVEKVPTYLAVVANFSQPPSQKNGDRVVFKIPKSTQQKIKIRLGKNAVTRGK
ncbi:MAG: type VI secretion system lipoprotein TssJ [candidate division Zixibacteria bacterium]|nr:type VI secretion system lipoprotein TssJ [candidate division Zixibacteria bacterium]